MVHQIKELLTCWGFSSSLSDSSMFLLRKGTDMIIILIYVDDIIVIVLISLSWQGPSLHLFQTKYIQNLFNRVGFTDCKPIATPMTTSHTLFAFKGSLLADPSQYHSILKPVNIGTTSFGLSFHSSLDLQLTAYANADWAGCPDDHRSTSGHCIFFGSNLVS
ncbi:hypothetical protein CK203_106527 [Vitis vinifera]|uniref:Retrovirus-related Pol polyprotein from transposon RE1 n=1 Tax=Vitis vinifera TaxID=29760 RepID=A0A438D5S3_VITVI|nr:hypothetical protein CK203_106527 [Vitis vinifera]